MKIQGVLLVEKNTGSYIYFGRGSNLESLIKSSRKKQSLVNIQLVISNNSKAKGLLIAKKYKIPLIYSFPKKKF